MKKTILLLTIASLAFFGSCKKADVKTTDNTVSTITPAIAVTAQNTLNVQSVKNLPNQDLKRMAYKLLTPVERYLLWLDNIQIVSANFNPQQKVLTAQLIAFLSPQILVDQKSTVATDNFRDQWLAKAEQIFTKDQIRDLAYKIYSSTDKTSTLAINSYNGGGDGDPTKLPTCNCHGGSVISCDGVSFCPTDYTHGDCDLQSWGCGWLGVQTCDNRCVTPD